MNYIKRSLIFILGLTFLMTNSLMAFSEGLLATPTASTVLVNGKDVAFDAYLIGGNNYFKLRDLAFALNGTEKQFSVGFDGTIYLTSGQPYTTVGGEMEGKNNDIQTPEATSSKIIKNGLEVQFQAYLINGNNYFKLRDIGEAFDFGVDWDGARNTIVIDTSKGYALDGAVSNNNEIGMKAAEEDDFTFNVPTDWVREVRSDNIYYYVDNIDFLMLGVSELSETINEEKFELLLEGVRNGFEKFTEIEKGSKDYDNGRKFYHIKFSGVISSQDVMVELYVISWSGKVYQFMMADLSGSYKYTEQMNNIISSVKFKDVYSVPTETAPPTGITSASELESYLKDNFGELKTEFKTFDLKSGIRIHENEDNFKCYDIAIILAWSDMEFELYDIKSSIKYTDEQKKAFEDSIKAHLKSMGDAAISAMPTKKLRGGFLEAGYKYPNLKIDYYENTIFGWKNYDYATRIFPYYEDTYVTEFHWHTFGSGGSPYDEI